MTAVDDFCVCGETNKGERAIESHVHRKIAESAAAFHHRCVSTCGSDFEAGKARQNFNPRKGVCQIFRSNQNLINLHCLTRKRFFSFPCQARSARPSFIVEAGSHRNGF